MNIFVVDYDPEVAAQSLIDVHVNKMVIEGSQMLANRFSLDKLKEAPLTASGTPRKHSYLHHPCSKWVLQSAKNFEWLLLHTFSLYNERKFRFEKDHFCYSFLVWCFDNSPVANDELTPFAQAMPEQYKHVDAVAAYRAYYLSDKKTDKNGKNMFQWTKRNPPNWCIT